MSETTTDELDVPELTVDQPTEPVDAEPVEAGAARNVGRLILTVVLTSILILGFGIVALVTFAGPWGLAIAAGVVAGLVALWRVLRGRAKKTGRTFTLRGNEPRRNRSEGRAAGGGVKRFTGGAGPVGRALSGASRSGKRTASQGASRVGRGASRSASVGASGVGAKRSLRGMIPGLRSGTKPGGPPTGKRPSARSRLAGAARGAFGRVRPGSGKRSGKRFGKQPGSTPKRGAATRLGRALGVATGGRLGTRGVDLTKRRKRPKKRTGKKRDPGPSRFARMTGAAANAVKTTAGTWKKSRGLRPKVAIRAARMAAKKATGVKKKLGAAAFGAGALGFAGAHKAIRAGHNTVRRGVSKIRTLAGRQPLRKLPALSRRRIARPTKPIKVTKKGPKFGKKVAGAKTRARIATQVRDVAREERDAKNRAQIAALARQKNANATGGTTMNLSESSGMMDYRRKLEQRRELLQEWAAEARQWADSSESEKPLGSMTMESIAEIAAGYSTLAEAAAEAISTFNTDHASDIERLENPRNNEPEWDASKNDA